MKSLSEIVALYEAIDRGFDSERQIALTGADDPTVKRIERKQLLNDQAYFVLCWGQLKSEIDEACRDAIRNRQSDSTWANRRGFDFYNPNDRRLSGLVFDRRVVIVLDRKEGPGSPFAKVMSYYALRNEVAHGSLAATRIDVSSVAQDFYVIQGALTR